MIPDLWFLNVTNVSDVIWSVTSVNHLETNVWISYDWNSGPWYMMTIWGMPDHVMPLYIFWATVLASIFAYKIAIGQYRYYSKRTVIRRCPYLYTWFFLIFFLFLITGKYVECLRFHLTYSRTRVEIFYYIINSIFNL